MSSLIFAINCGSSSLKYKVFDEQLHVVTQGQASNLGTNKALLVVSGKTINDLTESCTHHNILHRIIQENQFDTRDKVIKIVHRIVHGGDHDQAIKVVNANDLSDLDKLSAFAPLHNHDAVMVVRYCLENLKADNYVFFDTVFHHTMPEVARCYPISPTAQAPVPIRRYGFHGISYQFILDSVSEHLSKAKNHLNLIVCHLGSGASMCAIRQGQSIDTSMGLTPLEGLIGGTRSGSIDPSLAFHAIADAMSMVKIANGVEITKAEYELNKNAGLKALCGTSNFGEICNHLDIPKMRLAFDMFVDRVVSLIGAYWVKLQGNVDAVVFSGGIGERSNLVRKTVYERIAFLGISEINDNLNTYLSSPDSGHGDYVVDISSSASGCKILVAFTNEELQMARQVQKM